MQVIENLLNLDEAGYRALHEAALAAFTELLDSKWGPLLLPEYVFLEVVTVLARRKDLGTAVSVGDILLHAKEIESVPCIDFFSEALKIMT